MSAFDEWWNGGKPLTLDFAMNTEDVARAAYDAGREEGRREAMAPVLDYIRATAPSTFAKLDAIGMSLGIDSVSPARGAAGVESGACARVDARSSHAGSPAPVPAKPGADAFRYWKENCRRCSEYCEEDLCDKHCTGCPSTEPGHICTPVPIPPGCGCPAVGFGMSVRISCAHRSGWPGGTSCPCPCHTPAKDPDPTPEPMACAKCGVGIANVGSLYPVGASYICHSCARIASELMAHHAGASREDSRWFVGSPDRQGIAICNACVDRASDVMKEASEGETVEVRIPFAVARDGYVEVNGEDLRPHVLEESMQDMQECFPAGSVVGWITARVPKPSPPEEVEGSVTDE